MYWELAKWQVLQTLISKLVMDAKKSHQHDSYYQLSSDKNAVVVCSMIITRQTKLEVRSPIYFKAQT